MSVHPFGNRCVVSDPPADDQTPSGLILPVGVDDYAVGIVIEMEGDNALAAGSVVYYHKGHGVVINGVRVIGNECIMAWEPA